MEKSVNKLQAVALVYEVDRGDCGDFDSGLFSPDSSLGVTAGMVFRL